MEDKGRFVRDLLAALAAADPGRYSYLIEDGRAPTLMNSEDGDLAYLAFPSSPIGLGALNVSGDSLPVLAEVLMCGVRGSQQVNWIPLHLAEEDVARRDRHLRESRDVAPLTELAGEAQEGVVGRVRDNSQLELGYGFGWGGR